MNFRNILYAVALLPAALLTGCQDSYDAPEYDVPVAKLEANTTIAELKTIFGSELAVETPFKDADTSEPYIIKGRVISCDASGNIYRSLVIQDETAAIAFSIQRGSLYTDYPLGQEVVVNVTDLWIGQYNAYIQIGELGDYQGNPQISFMPVEIFARHAELNGNPDKDFQYVKYGSRYPENHPYCIVASLEQISSIAGAGEEYRNIMSQLVEIPNVSFVDGGKETFAPYQDNADRYIKDQYNNQLNVRCSGYSNFYNDEVPTGTGTVRGILSRYGDSWQLLLRDRDDVMFESKGTKSEPYSIEEVIDMRNNGRTAWTEGVIVGSVKAGVQSVESIDDICFTASQAELDNNVVIAPAADVRDLSQMLVVNLPAATKLREYVNLLDNPHNIGQELKVSGTFLEWLGMNGVMDSPGSFARFQLEGLNIPGVTDQGSGTDDDPYTVQYVISNPEEQTGVWVEGYIVGFVNGSSFGANSIFSNDASLMTNYSGNNIIIAMSIDDQGTAIAIPVSLSGDFRKAYGLKANPEVYQQKVMINGNIGTTFGAPGITVINTMMTIEE